MCTVCFLNDTAAAEISPSSLHDALPISSTTTLTTPSSPGPAFLSSSAVSRSAGPFWPSTQDTPSWSRPTRSEGHTSELQSPDHLVSPLLLEQKTLSLLLTPAMTSRHRCL